MKTINEQYKEFLEMCDIAKYNVAEKLLKDIIVDVVNKEGVELLINQTPQSRDRSFDYIGIIKNGENIENVGIDLKISKNKLGTERISALLVSAMTSDIKNIILVSNRELTLQAKKTASVFSQKAGLNFQVFGREDLDKWFSSYERHDSFLGDVSVHMIMKEMSRQLARRIALHPNEFMDLEWRDLERIIAIVFSDFGYNVELTPSAKDGGKDVIVWYKGESYIIEIKHWNERNKVGERYISDFLKVVLKENRKSGLYLSSSGYTANAFETLTKIEKTKFRYGNKTSMLTLMKIYERVNNGIYVPVDNLEQVVDKISDSVE